jgi:hypothetical protein
MQRLRLRVFGYAVVAASTLAACGSTGKPDEVPRPSRSCEAITAKLMAQFQEPADGDHVVMVMNDCQRDPQLVAPCVVKATTAAAITKQCTLPIDDAGSEGDALFGNK